MGKIALKLFSGINKIQLNAPIKFNKLRINKLRYITALDYEGVLSIQLQGLNINAYIDAGITINNPILIEFEYI